MSQRSACLRCNGDLPPYCGGPPRKWCSAKCQRGPSPSALRPCVQCGVIFESQRGITRCSIECRRERDRASLKRSRRSRGGYRSRAKLFGVEYQPFSRTTIFERDRWTCGICSRLVDAALSWPHPMSASLDHVIPMSKGGPHLPSNAQCAHLICNVGKGASMPPLTSSMT